MISVGTPINDAVIRLTKEGITYDLAPSGSDGMYTYLGDNLTIEPGDRFEFELEYLGETATATTDVPPAPVSVELDTTIMSVPNFDFSGGGGRGRGIDSRLLVTWNNDSDQLHYVVIESTEENPEAIFLEFIGQRIGQFRFISEPTRDNFFEVNILLLEGIGDHEVRVYRVNQEYADLYDNRTQDSRDLNQPPDNIAGALGIFSAFNSVAANFEVKRED